MDQHHIFLLHIWTEERETRHAPRLLRAALEDPHTGKRWGFPDIQGLVNFLEDRFLADEGERRLSK